MTSDKRIKEYTSKPDIVTMHREGTKTEEGMARKEKFERACHEGDITTALDIALDDVQIAVGGGASLDMSRWVLPKPDGSCSVCLAGAVMLCTLGLSDTRDSVDGSGWLPRSYHEDINIMLMLLNKLREGYLEGVTAQLLSRWNDSVVPKGGDWITAAHVRDVLFLAIRDDRSFPEMEPILRRLAAAMRADIKASRAAEAGQ